MLAAGNRFCVSVLHTQIVALQPCTDRKGCKAHQALRRLETQPPKQTQRLTLSERLLVLPVRPVLSSSTHGWSGLLVERQSEPFEAEVAQPPLTHHQILFYFRPSHRLFRTCESLRGRGLPPTGSFSVIPAGLASTWRWQGHHDVLSVFLPPGLLNRAADECAPGQPECRPVFDASLPQVRSTMLALAAELASGGPGGRLCAESLAVVLAVHLVRYFGGGGDRVPAEPPPDDARIAAALEYIRDNLTAELRLADIAEAARLSPYHFVRLFGRCMGITPHRYVIAQRVEQAKPLLRGGGLSLAQIAQRVGFSDHSHFTRHFKRLVGVPPSRYR